MKATEDALLCEPARRFDLNRSALTTPPVAAPPLVGAARTYADCGLDKS